MNYMENMASNNVALFSTGSSVGTIVGLLLSLMLEGMWFWGVLLFFMAAFYTGINRVAYLLIQK